MTENKAPILKEIMDADLSKAAITLGAGVDPDGLASQLAMATIIKLITDGKSNIGQFYRGDFDHPQNSTMKQLLNLNPSPEADFSFDDGYTVLFSMDGPSSVTPFNGMDGKPAPDFILDHHAPASVTAAKASDVRQIGACSSIAWEYVMEVGFDWNTEEGKILATALAIGIETDTRHGATESCSPLDYEALAFCQIHKDDKLYREIINYPKPPYYMDALAEGWISAHRDPDSRSLVTSVGKISTKQIWLIPTLAEAYGELGGIETSVVFGMVNGNIKISVRSTNSAILVDDFMQMAFESGGGKRGAGAATIEMPFLLHDLTDECGEKGLGFYRDVIIHRVLQVAGDGVRAKKKDKS